MLKAGLIFDSSAICYTNVLLIVMFLFPLHWKERKGFYTTAKWIYVIVNSLCIIANICDIVYFPFTGKRTTGSVLQEFSNEGVGQIANIIYEHAISNIHLVLAGIGLMIMFYAGFARPTFKKKEEKEKKNNTKKEEIEKNSVKKEDETEQDDKTDVEFIVEKAEEVSFTIEGKEEERREAARKKRLSYVYYYATSVVAFIIIGYTSWGLMRGGYTTATRPITISNANQYVNNPNEAGIVLNTPFSLIRTFNKKPFTVPNYMSMEEAESVYSPLHNINTDEGNNPRLKTQNPKLNVVVLILESFGKQHIGFYNKSNNENGKSGDKATFTPFLDKFIADSCYTFRYSFANGHRSIEGMPSVLSSIPSFVEAFFLTPASLNNLSGLARELSENKGYTSAFFHGAENGSMGFEAFARSTGFQQYFGLTEYCQDNRYHGKDDFDGTWAIWDEEFLQFYCDQMSTLQQPFITSVFTASSHSPFVVPERYNGKFPRGKHELQQCVAYSDNALRLFFEKAKTQPWFNNTIFVITADHTSGNVEQFYNTSIGQYRVPIILYAPSMPELRGYDDKTIVEQIDIMPTILGLLGYEKPYVAFGQDIFNTPTEDKFAIHWIPGTDDGYEFVKGDYLIQFDGEKISKVFMHKTDLLLEKNVINSVPKDEIKAMEKQLKAIVQQYMKRMNDNKLVISKENR